MPTSSSGLIRRDGARRRGRRPCSRGDGSLQRVRSAHVGEPRHPGERRSGGASRSGTMDRRGRARITTLGARRRRPGRHARARPQRDHAHVRDDSDHRGAIGARNMASDLPLGAPESRAPAQAARNGLRLKTRLLQPFHGAERSERRVRRSPCGTPGGPAARGPLRPVALAVLRASHESHGRPRIVDRAHLVVDQPHRESRYAHGAFGHVRGDPAGLLWPCHP